MADLPRLTDDDIRCIVGSDQATVYRLGSGGQKVVFRIGDDSPWVLKAIKLGDGESPKGDQTILEARARREFRILSDCNCPYLVAPGPQPLKITFINGQKVLTFSEEFVDGSNLTDVISNEAPLGTVEVKRLALQMSQAISALFTNGKIHRDIKPGNIMRRRNGDFVLLDPGLAFDIRGESLSDGFLVGTLIYFSPEQFEYDKRRSNDHRSDQFSLGVVLYEAATGKHPFRSSSTFSSAAIYIRIQHHSPEELHKSVRGFPPDLARVIARMMRKRPHLRFPKCDNLIKAIEAAGES